MANPDRTYLVYATNTDGHEVCAGEYAAKCADHAINLAKAAGYGGAMVAQPSPGQLVRDHYRKDKGRG
ncbi:hypothetical protein [Methylobacterium oxalidis]|uniref:hypothetical protein n=1 Tax=Methylobacterium oxalidis TaxID=944322 RepID=UPI0033153694